MGLLAGLALAAAAAPGACGGRVTGGAGTGGTRIGGTDSGVGATGGGTSWGGTGGTGNGGTGGTGNGGTGGTGNGGTGGTLPGSGGSGYGGTGGGMVTCNPADPNNSKCDICLQTTCCVQWEACEGNQYCPTEFVCIMDCIYADIMDAGSATNGDKAMCAESCPSSGSATIDVTTNDLFACANDPHPEAGASCRVVCLGG